MAPSVWERLRPHLELEGTGVVALSGGTDSSVLLAALVEAGQRVTAATFASILHPAAELGLARRLCAKLGVEHLVLTEDPLADGEFRSNPPDRCYLCKKRRLSLLVEAAAVRGIATVMDGGLASDTAEYRPGLKAVEEAGVVSPLARAGFDKTDVCELGRYLGLDEWLRPASACLATRVCYGEELSEDLLRRIDRAEEFVAQTFGIERGSFRVRVHGPAARLELDPALWSAALSDEIRPKLTAGLAELEFTFAALDLTGFSSGSMDRLLDKVDDASL